MIDRFMKEMENNRIVLALGGEKDEELVEKAVCNHGYFMMAPNKWMPEQKSLVRPLSIPIGGDDDDDHFLQVMVSISQSNNRNVNTNLIIIEYRILDSPITAQSLAVTSQRINQSIREQVSRMLRLSPGDQVQLNGFHSKYPKAKIKGFGRIFRSPTLFEDIVKSIILCNCSWPRSLQMAQALCNLKCNMVRKKKGTSAALKRKRGGSSDDRNAAATSAFGFGIENFPSAREIACLDEKTLNELCSLGLRSKHIINVARLVCDGKMKGLHDLDENILFRKLKNIQGFGPFTVANTMMCLGFYRYIPIDTETFKHLKLVHQRRDVKEKTVKSVVTEIYDKYAPFQCLVYWMEHVDYYEKIMGMKLSSLPHSQYPNVATSNFNS